MKPSEAMAAVASVMSQSRIGRIGPGLGDDAGAVARADLGLVGLDQGVDRRRIDIAFLDQDGFERPHPQLDFRQMAMVVVVVMMGMIMIVCHGTILAEPGPVPKTSDDQGPTL